MHRAAKKIKVFVHLLQKGAVRQWRTNKAPTGAGSGDPAGAREDSPTAWGKCHEVTKGGGPSKGTGRVRLAPVEKPRSGPRRNQQTGADGPESAD